MTVIDRDAVLASRIALAAGDAIKLVDALDALVAHPPMTGDDQEAAIRSIEEHISHSLWRCGRLKEFAK